MTTAGLLPEGFHDRLPPHADEAARVEARVLEAARLHGYERVDPPLAEFAAELAQRLKPVLSGGRSPTVEGAGGLTDAVRFVDPASGATLAIRPDLTAQVARIAATRMGHHPRPVRLSYAGPVLKLRGHPLAPARELRQVGAELIGLDTVAAACEVVGVAADAIAAAGVGTASIDFTLPDLVDVLAAGPLPVAAEAIDALRDRLDAKDAGAVAAIAPAYLPLVEAAGPFDAALERLRALDANGVLSSRLDGVAAVRASLGGRVVATLDPTERHGFEFQSWLGFSLFSTGSATFLGRGGTYAIVHADGREEPATGFSLYADALAGRGAPERRRLFVPLGIDQAAAARLRAAGWVTVAQLDEGDTPEAQLATHIWVAGEARAL